MRYDLATPQGLAGAKEHLNQVARLGKKVDIKRVAEHRSLNQNSYLHLILTAFGMHFGYTLEEAKQVYKQTNASTYYYKVNGRTFIRSSAKLSKEEMQNTIDKFMRKSAEQGCELPQAENAEWLSQIADQAEKNQYI